MLKDFQELYTTISALNITLKQIEPKRKINREVTDHKTTYSSFTAQTSEKPLFMDYKSTLAPATSSFTPVVQEITPKPVTSSLTCYNCQKVGHVTAVCPEPKKQRPVELKDIEEEAEGSENEDA